MKSILVSGFLGAGKTTVIESLAKYIVKTSASSLPLAIIENEIGEVGIDQELLKEQGLPVRELFAGCICCTLTTDLIRCLKELEEHHHPEYVVIEATGLARPSEILASLQQYSKQQGTNTLVVVDGSRWDKMMAAVAPLVIDQLTVADTVLMNKFADLPKQKVEEVRRVIYGYNPTAICVEIEATNGIDDHIWHEYIRGVA